MLRSLERDGALRNVVHIHCAREAGTAIFRDELRELHERRPGYHLYERHSAVDGRLRAQELERICPDWGERETFICGPAGLLAALKEHFEREGDTARLHHEHFQPDELIGAGEQGCGGSVRFCASGVEALSDGSQPILAAGEQAGATLPFGCRMGICHSCVGRLRSGRVRDLRTGEVHGQPGELLRTCVNAPEGAIEIDL
jgi:stearoyl-CoA 9-desaturase NADPH oxidoreductase